MAETTRTTSGNPAQNTSTSTSSGGARNASSPSSTTSGSPAGTSTSASTTGTTAASTSRSGAAAAAASQGQRSSAQGQQRQQGSAQQNQSQQSRSQSSERRDEEHRVELGGHMVSDAKKVGSELVGAARDSAISLIDAQRARAADQIVAIGDALRHSAESFEETGAGALTQYINQAADQICGFADTVRDRSWNELAGDLESFARRYPITFMASAMGIGFVLGRFLLSSSERMHAGNGGASHAAGRTTDMRREAGGTSPGIASSGTRAEYGSSGIRE